MAPIFSLPSLAGVHKRTFVLIRFTRCNTLVTSRWVSWFCFKRVSLHLCTARFKVTFLADHLFLPAPKTLGIHRKFLEIICIQAFLTRIFSFKCKNLQFLMLPRPSYPSLSGPLKLDTFSSPHTQSCIICLFQELFAIPKSETFPLAPVHPDDI